MSAAHMLIRKGLVLRMPSFHTSLRSLSTEQLMRGCFRCHNLNVNLESPSPQYLKHLIIEFSPGTSHVENFAFFQGGIFGMTTHHDGSVHIWDLRPPQDQPENHDNPIQIGNILATHNISQNIIAIGYQSSKDPTDMSILMTATCFDEIDMRTSVHTFNINFVRKENDQYMASFTPEHLISDISAFPTPGVIAQGGLAIALLRSSVTQEVLLVVVDYDRRTDLTVATGLESSRQWDVVLSGNDILLFSEFEDEVLFAAYLDLRSTLPPSGSLYIQRPPDVSRVRSYICPQAQPMEGLHWYTVHPWDTPHWQTDDLVPVIFEASRWEPEEVADSGWRSVAGLHWISAKQVIEWLKSGKAMPQEFRQIKYLQKECVRAWIDDATMLVPSTYGRRFVWVHRSIEPDHSLPVSRLETMRLQTPWDTGIEEDDLSTQLDVPIDLTFVHRIDFDDEYGRLLVVTNPLDRGPTAHILLY
ncbi:hypothetical protein M407DRAFT_209615 [Tulasnella calospora MUT 4182]|uniref:Uncharacterized protein n=1 Tax=Tulasnella calospora MUT 4182 TaxID=1051891 RepID=A0A0C3QMZ2_9AGAM|nr:hypothetical protein M407DRAFT_209615 [Tulasnella calospora MUT 4182]